MAARTLAVAFALVVGVGAASMRAAGSIGEGDPTPRLGAPVAEAGLEIVWLIRAEDYLTCETAAFALRRAASRPEAPVLRVVLVGDDGGLAEGFLRTERVDAQLVRISARELRQHFGGVPLPALYIGRRGAVHRLWSGERDVRLATEGDDPPLLAELAK